MANYSFFKTQKEIDFFLSKQEAQSWMYDCEGIFGAWVTDPETIKRVLPPPLEFANPVVNAYIINAFDPTFSTAYREAALLISATYNGQPGVYTLGMLLEGTENGVLLGREIMDLPKKNADSIAVRRIGDTCYGNVVRNGVCLMEIELELGEFNDPNLGAQVFAGRNPGDVAQTKQFCFRMDINKRKDEGTFCTNLQLNDVFVESKTKTWEPGCVNINLKSTANDPWAEVGVGQPIGGGWSRLDIGLLGSVLHPLGDCSKALPYLMCRYDAHILGKPNRLL